MNADPKRPKRERAAVKIAGALGLALAIALIVIGARRTHPLYSRDAMEFGIEETTPIADRDLVRDATFSGVTRDRKDGHLYSTYDRSKPAGKKACPT
jgi:hypothetical protein